MDKRMVCWMDGSQDENIPGKLLSDNLEFFGDMVYTGAEYVYLTPLESITDSEKDLPELRGHRLQDGRLIRRFGKEPATAQGILSMEWDFKQVCVFRELDFYCMGCLQCVTVLTLDEKKPITVYHDNIMGNNALYRLRLPDVSARRLRITLSGDNLLELYQMWAFGEAEEKTYTHDLSVDTFVYANSIAMESVIGAPYTAFTDVEGFYWMQNMKKAGLFEQGVVWSEQPAYDALAIKPILPSVKEANASVHRRLCKDGTEVVCLALTNTDTTAPRTVTVELENNTPVQAEWMVLGSLSSRWYGTSPNVLLNSEHTFGRSSQYRYLTNALEIADFPVIHLPAGGSCLFWVRLNCGKDVPAGEYTLQMRAGKAVKTITGLVLPLSLPKVHTGIMVWGNFTEMYPFAFSDRAQREVSYRRQIGANIYHGWPECGSPIREAYEQDPDSQFAIYALGDYGDRIYCDKMQPEDMIKPEVEADVARILTENVRKAESLGMGFDRWFLEMPDEPGRHNIKALRAFIELCKRVEPRVRIYVNPAFWVGFENGGVEDEETLVELLDGWYDKLVDISVPLVLNLVDRPKAISYFRSDREFNGQYQVAGQHMNGDRGALVSLPRQCAWDSISRDLNFWGFYSYYCPRLNSWDNTVRPYENVDGTINYQCVYGGVNGPLATRASEAIREGWQDYRLMQLVREKEPEQYRCLQDWYLSGEYTFEALREQALDVLMNQ